MKTYDLIYSDHLRPRLLRHLLFWLCWFLFMVLTYQIPMNDVIPNWDIKARMEFVQKKRGVDFITLRGGIANLTWEISYKQLRIILCQMAFTYLVIYYILPLYLIKRKRWFVTTLKLIIIISTFLAMQYFIIWLNLVDSVAEWSRRGGGGLKPKPEIVIQQLKASIVFNLATVVGVAVVIKLLKRWWRKQKETEMIARENLHAELQLLKAQVHPHFLFNSLNNIYSFALDCSPKAPEMIQKLTGLLRYMLYECKQSFVPLEKELNMIRDYISLERIRYGERFKMDLQIPTSTHDQKIAPLLLIPFIENSFKHGTSKMLSRPEITLHISVLENILYFKLSNSRPGLPEEKFKSLNQGLGLQNVKKRLALLYPRQYDLQIIDDSSSYTVWLKIKLSGITSAGTIPRITKEFTEYEFS